MHVFVCVCGGGGLCVCVGGEVFVGVGGYFQQHMSSQASF